MTRRGCVALVLHAHLPYPADGLHADRQAARWLLEAVWECYLPLVEVLDRLRAEGIDAPLTLSISPTLASLLRALATGPLLEQHLAALTRVNAQERARLGPGHPLGAAIGYYDARLRGARQAWSSLGADLLGALERHRADGRIELWSTSATHAYLPALADSPAAVQAQLRLGRRSFATLIGHCPTGLWLPECAFRPSLGRELARAGVGYTLLDAHGLTRALPQPPRGAWQPVIDRWGVAYFGRDQAASHQVWSRARGYPGDPAYRDFYRDVGFELPDEALSGLGAGAMTGLKYHRITGRTDDKQPYDPGAAVACVARHAEHFVDTCARRLAQLPPCPQAPPVLVAAYDAELFGHWWFEGPAFLEQVLRRLAASRELQATTLGGYLERHPRCPVVEPASSSWGEGGLGQVWVGRRTAYLWRHVHHAHRLVCQAVRSRRGARGAAGAALDEAIRQLMLLQASDWPFMIHGRDLARYARGRFRLHWERVRRLVEVARQDAPGPEQVRWVERVGSRGTLLRELSSEELRSAFER